MKVWPGKAYPQGGDYDGSGTNFSLFSKGAEKVELCLFDENGQEQRIGLEEVAGDCRHAYHSYVEPGQRCGYRVYGPLDQFSGWLAGKPARRRSRPDGPCGGPLSGGAAS